MIKLCYKEYEWKINLAACKYFFDSTGLDLQTVLMKYILACSATRNMSTMERMVHFSEVFTRDIACKALYSMIKQCDKTVPIAEIEDATFRVGWIPVDSDDDMCEPWPLVMVATALKVNDYFSSGIEVKKTVTSEGSAS